MYLDYRKGNIVVFDVSNTRLFELMDFLFCNRSLYFVTNHCVLARGALVKGFSFVGLMFAAKSPCSLPL